MATRSPGRHSPWCAACPPRSFRQVYGRDGLPIGLQVIGPRLEDRTVIDVAAHIAELTGGYLSPPGY